MRATRGPFGLALTGTGLLRAGLKSPIKIRAQYLGPSPIFIRAKRAGPYGPARFDSSNYDVDKKFLLSLNNDYSLSENETHKIRFSLTILIH
ncbi:hypothetical protein MTR_8g075410 [Medicago truncatula]|uniref:Uncharacterized protein n=1 Tax=Medicago truncatula TaxID=3880 RepID=G7LC14_MEDTR|nr:hypothetical protein MTR_8g075410 [Medicago truncatula]